jgi:Protein of Unknown function (DUF2784)
VLALGAAAVVAAGHMAFLVYLVLGGFLALRRLGWIWPHLGCTAWSVGITLTQGRCPLTTLEKWLLVQGGRTPYQDSYIGHYLSGTVFPAQYEIAVWLASVVVALASWALVLTRRQRPARVAAA